MENLKLTKEIKGIITKDMEGKPLTEKQNKKLVKFLREMETPKTTEQTEQQTEQTEQQTELSLDNWTELTGEQREDLKKAILKSKYGQGGEHFSLFPTLMDNNINHFITENYGEYKKLKANKQLMEQWKENGEITIIPLEIGNTINYMVTILPNKEMEMDIWELVNGTEKPYTKYTHYNKTGNITLNKGEYFISNIYTNKNKSLGQSKLLYKLLKLYGDNKQLDNIKDLKPNQTYLKKDLTENGEIIFREIGTNTHTPTGNTYNTIGEYLGREENTTTGINPLEYIS